MTEEDTFKRLKRMSWESTSELVYEHSRLYGVEQRHHAIIFAGWDLKDWLEEYFNRHKENILKAHCSKEAFVNSWLEFWNQS